MKSLLIEIGSEEIPARFISIGLGLLKEDIIKLLKKSSIEYGSISEYATPRRLALHISAVVEKQKDRTVESLGPSKKVAYDDKGAPTKAAIGFANNLGIDVNDLKIKKTDRGEYVSATIEEKGRPTIDVLSEAMPGLITSLQIPKSMRWGDSAIRYFRPIQWILAIFGTEIIPFGLESINSSNISYGHRFLSPVAIKIKDPSLYLPLLKQNHVLANPEERIRTIEDEITEIESVTSCKVHKDDELLSIVTNLVEYPAAVLGSFDKKYLTLPRELLITVMKTHQKYFSTENSEGNMLPSFIVISNTSKDNNDTVRKGAERVLRARLEDARFYYSADQKNALWDYVEGLKKVTFQEKLGSIYMKAERISTLASFIADTLNPVLMDKVQRVSMLCKADLVTGVVGEFPELQGYMGMIYARNSGEGEDIASAIYEHYLPRFSGDSMPSGEIGMIVSIADKTDNIASFFYLDMIPSGSEDPFALRRQAAGIINMLQNIDYPLTLNTLIDAALENHEPIAERKKDLTAKILIFFAQRLEGILLSQGYSHDIINSVLSTQDINLKDLKEKMLIISEFKKDPGFPGLLTSAKRVDNILAKVQPMSVNISLLSEPEEKTLYDIAVKVQKELASADYKSLFKLEVPVNTFFDKVLVMDKNPEIKNNRLALLSQVKSLFTSLANFSKILE